ncbi:MAG: putative amidohydrolase YtcJ, partial [Candidatus Promineifilaceae bacterium]
RPTAEAVLVDDAGRIAGVGRLADLQHDSAEIIDLHGRTLIPGFNDAHTHVSWLGMQLTLWVDARQHVSPDIPTIIERYRVWAADKPAGTWVNGMGYNEALLPEGRHLTYADLDQASIEHPLFLIRSCGHVGVANSLALELAGISAETPDPPGGIIVRDADGRPTGQLQETAMTLVQHLIPEPTTEEKKQAIEACCQYLLTLGVTAATDPDVMPEWLDIYREMDAADQLSIRLNMLVSRRSGDRIVPLPEKSVSDRLRCDSVKFFADGGMTSATAAISIPFRETGTKGVLIFETEVLADLMWEAHSNGFRIATHANGDVALEQVIGVYELVSQREPRPDLRHRIEHLALPTDDHLRRCADLGVMVATQTVFLSAMGATFRRYMPEVFYERAYGVRAMQAAGITVALSTDAPVVPDSNPFLGLKAAIDRHDHAGNVLGAEQGISAEAALKAYTLTGAVLSGDEANFGSIEVGKWADLAVLNGDPVTTPVAEMLSLQAVQTYVAGKLVFERAD